MNALTCSLLTLVLASSPLAQQPAGRAGVPVPVGFDRQQAHGICRDDSGTPWAVGADYKASFTAGAMEFVPALGASCAHRRPLTYRVQTIAVGGVVLHDARSEVAPAPHVAGHRVTYARGALQERHDATPRGIELSFLLPERPSAPGDLIVRGTITTDLAPERLADGTLRFTDSTSGGVTIGAVTGVAADGARCAGSLEFADGVLELRLPAAFVAAASYPLVLDPLIGTWLTPGNAGGDDSEATAAYEGTHGVYLVVWRRSFSATDQDIRAQRVGSNGVAVGSLIQLTSTTTAELRPAVATVNQRDCFVVTWQSGGSPFGPWSVQARTVAAATGVVGAQVAVAGGALQPAICGDRSATTAVATIVWHDQGTGIAARTATVDAAGAITLGPVHLVATAGDVVSGPAIGKANVAGGVTVVTWETATTTNSLHARAIGHDAVALGSVLPIVLGFAGSLDHAVDGDGQQFVMVHRQGQLYVTRLSWNGTALSLGTASSVPGAFAPRTPAIGWLGDRYLIAWQETTANPFDSDVYVRTYDATCTPCSQRITLPTASGANQRKPTVAPQHAGAGASQEALVVWDETATTVPFTSNVVAHRFAPMLGAPPVVLGPACGGGGTAGTNGPFALGNQQFRFTLTGGDPQAPLALLSLGIGQPPVVCGCSFTQAITNYAFFVNGGAAEFLFPVPCGTGLLGFQLEFQWLLLGAAASPCPVVPGLVASERVRLTIAE